MMKHIRIVSSTHARTADSQSISPSVIIAFIVAILQALAPVLTALKTPAT